MIWQIENHLKGIYENPAIVPLILHLTKTFGDKEQLCKLATAASDYIRCIVSDRLSGSPSKKVPGTMPALIELCEDRAGGTVDIFSLNHDRVVEAELAAAKIAFTDGFKEDPDGRWDATAYDRPDPRVRLWKLHGGIDWDQDPYGFRDKGINRLLLDGLAEPTAKRQLCIVHEDPRRCLTNGRRAIRKLIDDHRVIEVKRWFEDVSAEEIHSAVS